MCGGNGVNNCACGFCGGLSPRVRGKRLTRPFPATRRGSIPACAGETHLGTNPRGHQQVYPRVCGGNRVGATHPQYPQGLSPRVRGKRAPKARVTAGRRSIPACAGETHRRTAKSQEHRVYPRVCGGNASVQSAARPANGLSPRVRGKPCSSASRYGTPRSIPACAGETCCWPVAQWSARVYPRVCGGNNELGLQLRHLRGLSPRVRGKRRWPAWGACQTRSIPACAGETETECETDDHRKVYPRVCGGNRLFPEFPQAGHGLSPRVRGKPAAAIMLMASWGSIPACAGETSVNSKRFNAVPVYPRVCGGNCGNAPPPSPPGGLSPRVRGKRWYAPPPPPASRSIPACAGETSPAADSSEP